MLTVSADSDDVLDALQAGRRGYMLKGTSPEEIADAVRAVYEGETASSRRPSRPSVLVSEIRRSRDRHLRTPPAPRCSSPNVSGRSCELLDEADRRRRSRRRCTSRR